MISKVQQLHMSLTTSTRSLPWNSLFSRSESSSMCSWRSDARSDILRLEKKGFKAPRRMRCT